MFLLDPCRLEQHCARGIGPKWQEKRTRAVDSDAGDKFGLEDEDEARRGSNTACIAQKAKRLLLKKLVRALRRHSAVFTGVSGIRCFARDAHFVSFLAYAANSASKSGDERAHRASSDTLGAPS